MHNPKTTKPTMALEGKLKPEAETGKQLKALLRHMKARAKQGDFLWMDIENSTIWPDWNNGRLPPGFFEGGPSTYKYKSFAEDLKAIAAEGPAKITPKSHATRKLAVRVTMFWTMRGATPEERADSCPPGANTTETNKWLKDMGYQWSNCKSRTLKRIVALVLYLISRPAFLYLDRGSACARREHWDASITEQMLLFAFNFWRDAIDFRWILGSTPRGVEKHRASEEVSAAEQELARDMEREARNRLVGWLDLVYLYAVDTVADDDTEWPVACDVRLSAELKLWGECCDGRGMGTGFWWERSIGEVPVGAGKFTRVLKRAMRDDE